MRVRLAITVDLPVTTARTGQVWTASCADPAIQMTGPTARRARQRLHAMLATTLRQTIVAQLRQNPARDLQIH